MVVDFSAITKQRDLGTATKWPHLNVASSSYLEACIAAFNATRYLDTQGRALPIDVTSICVLPKFSKTKICQQFQPRASHAQA